MNGALAIAVEAVGAAVGVMLLPSLILAFFVAELTPSYTTIGLVPAIATSFWTLGRLPANLITAYRRRKQPWVFGAALVRVGAIGLLAVAASPGKPDRAGSVRAAAAWHALPLPHCLLPGGWVRQRTGAALLRASAPGRVVGFFARKRASWTALLSVAGALIVSRMLGTSALAFPGNYGRLFWVVTACLIAVTVLTAAMQERSRAGPVSGALAASPRTLRQPLFDPRFRRFLVFRVLFSATAAIDPFLFLYAVTRLGIPPTAIGGYALAAVLGWVVSAPAWLWLERKSGTRAVLQGAAVARLIAPALALVLPPLAATDLLGDHMAGGSSLTNVFGAAFIAIGAAVAAQSRGNFDYLARTAPPPLLPAYSGLTNAVLAIVAFAPVVGGSIIQRSGYEALFGAAAALGLACVFAGGWLAEAGGPHPGRANAERGRTPVSRALSAGQI